MVNDLKSSMKKSLQVLNWVFLCTCKAGIAEACLLTFLWVHGFFTVGLRTRLGEHVYSGISWSVSSRTSHLLSSCTSIDALSSSCGSAYSWSWDKGKSAYTLSEQSKSLIGWLESSEAGSVFSSEVRNASKGQNAKSVDGVRGLSNCWLVGFTYCSAQNTFGEASSVLVSAALEFTFSSLGV